MIRKSIKMRLVITAALLQIGALFGTRAKLPAQPLSWAQRAGGSGTNEGFAIAADDAGNSYVTGYFVGTATFGTGIHQVTVAGNDPTTADIFVAKYHKGGNLVWVKHAGGLANDTGFGITVDSAGNSYVTGSFQGTATFGEDAAQVMLTGAGSSSDDIFVAKYDASGVLQWAKRAGGGSTASNFGNAVSVNRTDNTVYVTGQFDGTAEFGEGAAQVTLNGAAWDGFVAKYDSGGNLLWARKAGGTGDDRGLGIAVDGAGNCYVAGRFFRTATFGTGPNQITLTAIGVSDDVFVAKYDSSGNLLWAQRAGGPGFDEGWGIAVDGSGNSYVTGTFQFNASFGAGPASLALTARGFQDVFVAKYDTDGILLWVSQVGASAATTLSGNIAVDGAGNSYITGSFDAPTLFAPSATLNPSGAADIFLAEYGTNGSLLWATQAGGSTAADLGVGLGVAVDKPGRNLFLTGNFRGTAAFGLAQANATTLSSQADIDIFVAKFDGCKIAVDFERDCKSDIGIYRDGTWSILGSSTALIVDTLGGLADTPVPADYDGDGKNDIAVYRPSTGVWQVKRSLDGVVTSVEHGGGTFIPVVADYDGDGKADIAVFSGGVWSILRSSDGGNTVIAHGGPGWTPVPGDYDGDGKADAAVYINGAWSIKRSSDGVTAVSGHGGPSWTPVPADYDGDGKTDIAVYTVGAWSILRSSDSGNTVVGHGGPTWEPVPADYDGDGKTDISVHLSGAWSIVRSSNNTITVVGHGGGPTDVPLH